MFFETRNFKLGYYRLAAEENASQSPSTLIASVDAQQNNAVTHKVDEVVLQEPLKPPTKRLKGIAWQHFERIMVNGPIKTQCNHCKSLLRGESKNGTKHLLDHMKICKAKNQPDIRQKILASNPKSDLSTYLFSEKDGRNALAKMVILHEYPLAIVDHIGFRNFTRTIQPLFECPSRNTLKSDIIKLYEIEKSQVFKSLETSQSRVVITTDMWTSGNQKKKVCGYHMSFH